MNRYKFKLSKENELWERERAWKAAREMFLTNLKNQGLTADEEAIEKQMLKIKGVISFGIPVEMVMNAALEIVIPETVSSRVDFWERVMDLYFYFPVQKMGCSIAESMSRSGDFDLFLTANKEIERDTFIYNLPSDAQLSLFFQFAFDEDLSTMMLPSDVVKMRDNTDVMFLLGAMAAGDGRLTQARKYLSDVNERLDEPDQYVTDILNAIDQQGNGSNASFRRTIGTRPVRREAPKIGRNAPCPCGSGLKYKQCCGKNA